MSDTSGATHKLLLATSLVLINSLFAGETLTYDYSGGGGRPLVLLQAISQLMELAFLTL
ncbi:hypothetical protein [Campylobacter fetus]|uniref:hypothetical protein n=1 Tax=Campylobacter fetus TaxID=196 RepID=UPI000A4A5BB3|nr:hypothetical protein [Campylobacter fetus]